MAVAKGIQHDARYKLGKRTAKRDRRNLKFAKILRAPAKIPKSYDFDNKHKGVPTPMFDNDELGDCVIAGRAHQTLRFELLEQNKIIRITNQQVRDEYFEQTGGNDTGLIVLESLKLWRKRGWKIGKTTYKIEAFTQLDRDNQNEVMQAIFLDVGVGIGLGLPFSAQDQLDAGEDWDVATGSRAKVNSWGGHYVLVTGYMTTGLNCVTWGAKQHMTWAFFDKYCDEAYAIIDAVNTLKQKRALNILALASFLQKHIT